MSRSGKKLAKSLPEGNSRPVMPFIMTDARWSQGCSRSRDLLRRPAALFVREPDDALLLPRPWSAEDRPLWLRQIQAAMQERARRSPKCRVPGCMAIVLSDACPLPGRGGFLGSLWPERSDSPEHSARLWDYFVPHTDSNRTRPKRKDSLGTSRSSGVAERKPGRALHDVGEMATRFTRRAGPVKKVGLG